MRQIGTAAPERREVTRPLPRNYVTALETLAMPTVVNRETDGAIPSRLFCNWIEAGKARQVRRALTGDERRALEERRDEIAPALWPFNRDSDGDRVALSLVEMYGGFPSMRGGEDDATGRVDAAMNILAEWPAWAIQKACAAIRRNGVWRRDRNGDFKFDRQWPPSEAELVDAVRKEAALYRDTYDRCVALLTATVEDSVSREEGSAA